MLVGCLYLINSKKKLVAVHSIFSLQLMCAESQFNFCCIFADISEKEIVNVTLPTGIPVLLELDEDLKPVKPRQLLGDQEKIKAAIKKVEDQGKVNKPSK